MRALSIFLVLGVFLGCGDEQQADHEVVIASDLPASVVEVESVSRGSVARRLVSSTVVESVRVVDLVPQATGVVRSIRVDEGDAVRKGQLLAVLENVSLESGSQRASKELDQLEVERANKEQLFKTGAISQKELNDVRFRVENARIGQSEARYQAVQTQLVSPISGVISKRDLREGEWFSGGKSVFQIVDPAQLKTVVSLPERDLSLVRLGQRGHLSSAYDAGQSVEAVVSRIGPVVDPKTGTFRVTLSVLDERPALRPGQFVSVDLEVERRDEVLTAPRKAIVWEDGKSVLYRLISAPEEEEKEDDDAQADEPSLWASLFGASASAEDEPLKVEMPEYVAERVPVEIGLENADLVEVRSGLNEGDSLIVVGQSHLADGSRVRTEEMQLVYLKKRKELKEAAKGEKTE